MVTRVGHMAFHVKDLDAAVEFQHQVLGMVETERVGNVSYLTCNDRHHELILIEDLKNSGYDHLGLEVPDARVLEGAAQRLTAAGGTMLGGIYDGEAGIDRALKVRSPNGHVYKLFCGMETVPAPPPGDRPEKFEHISTKVRRMAAEEQFFTQGLGFRFSDRMGFLASWWHCDEDHHGLALSRAPKSELHHYAYTWRTFQQLGDTADRLRDVYDKKCIWGPSRHGPGNNQFLYFHDADGAMVECCADIAQMQRDRYQPRTWSMKPSTINVWGGPPPLHFFLTGFPIARPVEGRPVWAFGGERTPTAASAS